jgi:very-short-patch-repair endonuclease
MFAPNASFRVGVTTDDRDTVEADFLVWRKLGVLDVDGPWHTGRAAEDHERDRRLREHGIRVVERYPAEALLLHARRRGGSFLRLLERNGWPLPSEAS